MLELDTVESLARTGTVSSTNGKRLRLPALLHAPTSDEVPDVDGLLVDQDIISDLPKVLACGNSLTGGEDVAGEFFLKLAPRPFYPQVPRTDPELPYDEIEGEKGPVRIYTLPFLDGMRSKPNELVDAVVKLRERITAADLIYAPACVTAADLALFIYLGIDIVDTTRTALIGARGELDYPGPETEMDGSSEKNIHVLTAEMKLVRNMLSAGRLRELVEARCASRPWMDSALRYLDLNYSDHLEQTAPMFRKGPYLCSSTNALTRPEVLRHKKRIEERYVPPASPDVLLLLPCSMKKPYSTSRSHKKMREVLFNTRGWTSVHEVILTSPLGVVPRELEGVYPVRAYDIGVAGVWNASEVELIRDMLRTLLSMKKYRAVVCHFPDKDVVEPVLSEHFDDVRYTCVEHRPTSPASLESLAKALNEVTEKGPSPRDRMAEDFQALGSYQLGKDLETISDTRPKGKFYSYKLYDDSKEQVAMLNPHRGTLVFSSAGGKRLVTGNGYKVIIEDFEIKGDILAVGVKDASPEVREGDEVVVVNSAGDLKAVGTATMAAAVMVAMNRGMAVSVRHKY